MVSMDRQIQSHEFDELFVFAVAHEMREIVAVVFILVDGGEFAIFVDVAVDTCGDGGKFGDEGHGVFKGVFPVFLLVETLGIGLSERGFMFQCRDSYILKLSWTGLYQGRIEPWGGGQWDIGQSVPRRISGRLNVRPILRINPLLVVLKGPFIRTIS